MKFVIATWLGLPWHGEFLKEKTTIRSDSGVWAVSNITLTNFGGVGAIGNYLDRNVDFVWVPLMCRGMCLQPLVLLREQLSMENPYCLTANTEGQV